MAAVLHGPGEGEHHAVGPAEVTIKATANDFFLAEGSLPAKTPGPPPHTHEKKTDMFFVLEGTLSVLVGDDWQELAPGSFVAAPPGVTHSFRNDGDAPVRFLNMSTPGGWERYMRDVAEVMANEGMSPEVIAELGRKHDVQFK